MKTISIISTTYSGEKSENLDECLFSIFSQNVMPEKVILVADGKLTPELYGVVGAYRERYPDVFVFHETETNKGNWFASNTAISLCETDIIAKIDSDDILLPDYTAKMLAAFESGADICGVYIEEFDDVSRKAINVKKTPVRHEKIYAFAKQRNPFNNPGIAFSRKLAVQIGGYNEMERCEDYDFVVRMLMAGAKAKNIPEILVRYRTNSDNLKRRKNFKNTKWFIISRWRIHKMGFSSFKEFIVPSIAQIILFIMPISVTERFYRKLREE